jgi:DNA-binding transcriptional regulator/RsmH inhibitor MraZ
MNVHVALSHMAKLQDILEELKTLPPEGLERVAEYIHGLQRTKQKERKALLRRTAGSLSHEEADELARIIEEGCEQIDERDW